MTIFNTRAVRADPEVEEKAKDNLAQAIVAKEGSEVVEAAGGPGEVTRRVPVYTFWVEP